jgi:hypothetical protein
MGREKLGPRSPEGYYVILARPEAAGELEGIEGLIVEEVGGTLCIKTRSRSAALKLYRRLAARGLLMDR